MYLPLPPLLLANPLCLHSEALRENDTPLPTLKRQPFPTVSMFPLNMDSRMGGILGNSINSLHQCTVDPSGADNCLNWKMLKLQLYYKSSMNVHLHHYIKAELIWTTSDFLSFSIFFLGSECRRHNL